MPPHHPAASAPTFAARAEHSRSRVPRFASCGASRSWVARDGCTGCATARTRPHACEIVRNRCSPRASRHAVRLKASPGTASAPGALRPTLVAKCANDLGMAVTGRGTNAGSHTGCVRSPCSTDPATPDPERRRAARMIGHRRRRVCADPARSRSTAQPRVVGSTPSSSARWPGGQFCAVRELTRATPDPQTAPPRSPRPRQTHRQLSISTRLSARLPGPAGCLDPLSPTRTRGEPVAFPRCRRDWISSEGAHETP